MEYFVGFCKLYLHIYCKIKHNDKKYQPNQKVGLNLSAVSLLLGLVSTESSGKIYQKYTVYTGRPDALKAWFGPVCYFSIIAIIGSNYGLPSFEIQLLQSPNNFTCAQFCSELTAMEYQQNWFLNNWNYEQYTCWNRPLSKWLRFCRRLQMHSLRQSVYILFWWSNWK